MRAWTFLPMGCLLWAGSATPLLAATSAPGAPPAASGSKGSDDALSPSTLPKARQTVKESGTSQVDELSPDERRRLDRMRARAAASKPNEKAAAGKPSETEKPHTEAAAPAKPKVDQPKAEQAIKEQAKPEQARTAAPQVAKVPAPPKGTAPVAARAEPRTAESALAAPSTRQAARRLHRRSREAADLDRRRSSPRAYPYRRGWPEVADRAPRVGDVVPPDAPLYPVPPGYGRGYPPFPSDDGYPPPRRGFMPW